VGADQNRFEGATMPGRIATAVGGALAEALLLLMPLGALYWLWIAIRLGNFGMFLLGLLGPAVPLTAPVGLYMLCFGTPYWIIKLFG
jgi:hypothetical protein